MKCGKDRTNICKQEQGIGLNTLDRTRARYTVWLNTLDRARGWSGTRWGPHWGRRQTWGRPWWRTRSGWSTCRGTHLEFPLINLGLNYSICYAWGPKGPGWKQGSNPIKAALVCTLMCYLSLSKYIFYTFLFNIIIDFFIMSYCLRVT